MVGNHEDRRFKLFSENRAKMHPNQYIRIVKTLTIQIPETVDFDDFEALMAIASTLYSKGRLSLGQAADLAGLSKRAFMEALGAYGVSVFNYPSSELDRDIETVRLHGAGL